MAKRTIQQINGDIACGYIELLFRKEGWACDRVVSDYGEDLILQPVREVGGKLPTLVDNFRVLLQAKGISSATKELWSVQIERIHIARWLRLNEPFILAVCAINSKSKEVRYLLPHRHFRLHEFSLRDKGKVSVTLGQDDLLDGKAINSLAWHFRQQILADEITKRKAVRVPTEFGHLFQNNSAINSNLIRPLIPI